MTVFCGMLRYRRRNDGVGFAPFRSPWPGSNHLPRAIEFLTAEWKGERFPDGRPKVPDSIVARMKKVSIEEAWEVLRKHGYTNQFEGGWKMVHDDVPVVGRAFTAHYMPARVELASPHHRART